VEGRISDLFIGTVPTFAFRSSEKLRETSVGIETRLRDGRPGFVFRQQHGYFSMPPRPDWF